MPKIGDMAPEFQATSTQGLINFPKDYCGKWLVLFSYQADFTPVCTTEIMSFASMEKEFQELGTQLVGMSVDSIYSHIAWLRKIKEIVWKDIKRIEVTFPLVSDPTREIAKNYGLIQSDFDISQMESAVFIIDQIGMIRAILYYPDKVGRNIQEIKRMIVALQLADTEHVAIPSDWHSGEDIMLVPADHYNTAVDRINKVNKNIYCMDWFLCFRQS